MSTYEQTIEAFAQGRRLLRLRRPIREHADAICDACGSAQPRILHVLRDLTSNRYFFVGQTCLSQLVQQGVVLRSFGKEVSQSAYTLEMEHRAQEKANQAHHAPSGDKASAVGENGSAASSSSASPYTITPTATHDAAHPEQHPRHGTIATDSGVQQTTGLEQEPPRRDDRRPVTEVISAKMPRDRSEVLGLSLRFVWPPPQVSGEQNDSAPKGGQPGAEVCCFAIMLFLQGLQEPLHASAEPLLMHESQRNPDEYQEAGEA